MCKWLYRQKFPWGDYLNRTTFRRIKLFKWAYKHRARFSVPIEAGLYIPNVAKQPLIVEMVRFVISQQGPLSPDNDAILVTNIRDHSLADLKVLAILIPSSNFRPECYISAIQKGDMNIIKWLHESGCPLTEMATNSAAFYGKLDILQYLVELGCPINLLICEEIISNFTSISILEYLLSIGALFTDRMGLLIEERGHRALKMWYVRTHARSTKK
jgi:hypothetical protein